MMHFLYWLLGIIILIYAYYTLFLFNELKILLFDKSLTAYEKEDIVKELRLLILVPIINIACYLYFPFNRFIAIPVLYIFLFLIAFIFLKGKKDRTSELNKDSELNKEKIIEDGIDFISEGKDIGDELIN